MTSFAHRHCEERSDEAIPSSKPFTKCNGILCMKAPLSRKKILNYTSVASHIGIASLSHTIHPSARNDDVKLVSLVIGSEDGVAGMSGAKNPDAEAGIV